MLISDIFASDLVKESLNTITIISIIGLTLLLKIVRDFITDVIKNTIKKISNKMTFKESAGLIAYIRDRLVELRTILDADRAYIHEFKNGEHFSAKNPVWRVFRTYEKCREGVIYQSSTIKGENVSTIFDTIEPVLMGSTKNTGMYLMDCKNCKHACKGRNTVIFKIDELPHTASRQMMMNHTIKLSVQVGLIVRNNTVGILAIDFCDELSKTLAHNQEWASNCCKTVNEYADRVEYALTNPEIFKAV
jgi:hypothetical protein